MKKTAKIAFVVVLALMAAVLIFSLCHNKYGCENYDWSHTASGFQFLEVAVKFRCSKDKKSLEDLENMHAIEEFGLFVDPELDPTTARFDARGQPLQFIREELDDRVVLMVRSTIAYKKKWPWNKDRPLVMEITIFHDRQRPFEIKQLWRSE